MSAVTRWMSVYGTAAVLIRLADEGARVGLALLGVERTGSAAVGGALVASFLVPHVFAAPLVGLAVDRSRRPAVLIAMAAATFGAALVLTVALLGRIPLAVVIFILLCGGSCGPALTGAMSSQVGELVPSGGWPRALGVDSLTYNAAGIAGPAAVAVLAVGTSPAVAVCVLGASAVLGALLVALLPIRRPSARTRSGGAHLMDGIRFMTKDTTLVAVTAATCVAQLGVGALPVFLAVASDRVHHPAMAGLLLAATAAGGLIGSLLWTWRPARPGRASLVVMAGLVGAGLPVLAGAIVSASLGGLTILFALSGLAMGPTFGALLTVRQHRSPKALRSQVFALGAGAKITAAAAGAALAGTVSNLDTGVQLVMVAGCSVIAGLLGAVALRGRRTRGCDQAAQPAISGASRY